VKTIPFIQILITNQVILVPLGKECDDLFTYQKNLFGTGAQAKYKVLVFEIASFPWQRV